MKGWWLVLALAACDGGDDVDIETDSESDTEPVDPEDMPGAPIYAANCASCHGDDGEGGIGPTLAGRIPNVPSIINIVTNGGGGMTSFRGVLTEQEIQDVAEYAFERFVP